MTADIVSLTPDELRRRIAECLGYTVVPYDDDINREDGFPESTWQVVDPGGRGSALPPDITALESAWQCAMQPDFDGMSLIPDWPGDLNAAIELVTIWNFGLSGNSPNWRAGFDEFWAIADTPALAICRAWIAWMEANTPPPPISPDAVFP